MKQQIPDNWLTHSEKTDFAESPDYKETINYFKKFEEFSPFVKIIQFGSTPQHYPLYLTVVSKNKYFTPEKATRSDKAIVLIQNCIHPGEAEGKDASMLLLRKILVTKELAHLLDNVILLIIPVFNIDGHERLSPFNRPNQNGPKKMGWRVNALNLNLNRDYMKADSPEMKAWLKMFSAWLPDFIIDNHTTNGADYQYHITYAIERYDNIDSGLAEWINNKFLNRMLSQVEKDGFITAPYFEFKNGNIKSGLIESAMIPRLSNGYSAVQNRICLLIETHSLKPFKNRVFSTLSMVTHSLDIINKQYKQLLKLNKEADLLVTKNRLKKKLPLAIDFRTEKGPTKFLFKGFKTEEKQSEITGSTVPFYSDIPEEFYIPNYNKIVVTKSVIAPTAYLIPAEFANIVSILNLHGIKTVQLFNPKEFEIEKYRFKNVKFHPRPYEGRQMVDFEVRKNKENYTAPIGSYIVSANQRTLRVIVNLLEPEAPDSFVKWGFFNAFFERKEYAEVYIMEPVARQMMRDPYLRKDFQKRLKEDESFKTDPGKRLDFFYRHSAFYDKRENIYPIFRII